MKGGRADSSILITTSTPLSPPIRPKRGLIKMPNNSHTIHPHHFTHFTRFKNNSAAYIYLLELIPSLSSFRQTNTENICRSIILSNISLALCHSSELSYAKRFGQRPVYSIRCPSGSGEKTMNFLYRKQRKREE